MTDPVTPDEIAGLGAGAPRRLARRRTGRRESSGFQWIEPWHALPPEAASIATFTAPGRTGARHRIGAFRGDRTGPRRALGYALDQCPEILGPTTRAGSPYYQSARVPA